MVKTLRKLIAEARAGRWVVVETRREDGSPGYKLVVADTSHVLFVDAPGGTAGERAANARLLCIGKNLLPTLLDALEAAVGVIRTAQVYVSDEDEGRVEALMDHLVALGMTELLLPREFQDEVRD